jgi:predicted outer membrane repeat protein
LSSPPAFAVDPASITIHVDDDACPGSGGGTEADPFCSIQDALDVAFDGDDILVEPGTYNETINFLGKAVALRSAGGRDVTTIDAAGLDDTVVRCVNGEGPDTVLDGFTITNGIGVNGGGMRMVANTPKTPTSPTITRCRFSNNVATNLGGGLFANNSNSVVSDTIFIDNMTMGEFSTGGGIKVS